MKSPGQAESEPERRLERVLEGMEAWHGLAVRYAPAAAAVMSPLHQAVDSQCWRIEVEGEAGAFFLKIAHDDLILPPDVTQTYRIAQAVAGLGLTARPRHLSPAAGAAVYDALDDGWRVAHVDDLIDPARFERLVAAKKAVHALPAFGRDVDVFATIEALAARAAAARLDLPAELPVLLARARQAGAAIAAAGSDRHPCHADGIISNVMLGPDGRLALVDFDESGDADPLFDLALVCNEVFAFTDQWAAALEMLTGRASPAALGRLRLYAFADDLRWGLWGHLMDHTSPRRDVEFLKYAQWRLLRCRMALGAMPFDDLLHGL